MSFEGEKGSWMMIQGGEALCKNSVTTGVVNILATGVLSVSLSVYRHSHCPEMKITA